MNCPVCIDKDLVMSDRQGIEIDYCPQCRGVWLDRGELDKIIERSAAEPAQRRPSDDRPGDRSHSQRHDSDHDERYDPRHKKKRGGLLGDLFDFG